MLCNFHENFMWSQRMYNFHFLYLMSKNKLALGQLRRVLHANIIPFLKSDCEPKTSTNRHRIDIRYTLYSLYKSRLIINNVVQQEKQILFVGTEKVNTADYPSLGLDKWVKKIASYVDVWYVNKYWVGGLLTNYNSVKFAIEEYCNLCSYSIKKGADARKFTHLKIRYEGLVKIYSFSLLKVNNFFKNFNPVKKTYVYMQEVPDLVVLVSPNRDFLATSECYKLGITTIAIVDTDCKPSPTGISIVAGLHCGVILPVFYTLLSINNTKN